MSSILKALKKLEQEKTLLEESAGINVSREILKQSSGNRNIIRWFWLLGGLAAVVIIFLSVALMQKSAPKDAVQSALQPFALQPALPAVPMQSLSTTPDTTGSAKGSAPSLPSAANQPNPTPTHQTPGRLPDNQVKKENTGLSVPAPSPEDPPKGGPSPPPATPRPTPVSEPGLTLSGIAWNKDSADRLAIINGQPTATGAIIRGARVEEILQDRVKLSRDGLVFELLIGRDARTD